MTKYGMFLLALLSASVVVAQQPVVRVALDSGSIWIGQQTRFTMEVVQQPGVMVQFPFFSDEIPGGLEIVEPLQTDTTVTADGLQQITHSYVVTAFTDSLLYIPPFPFVADADTVWSKSVSLKVVQPFELDMESNSITDIKPVFRPKFNWKGLLRIVLLVLAVVAIGIALYIFIKKYILKKPALEATAAEPERPPHELALEALNRLKEEKNWQKGRTKEYYTQLTDIVRLYIDRVFGVNACEMTSNEILQGLRQLKTDDKELYGRLQAMLSMADLVKFAKWFPYPEECEQNLKDAFFFVERTMPQESVPTEAHTADNAGEKRE